MNAPITTPRERPILFSDPMVRALLDGSKTQTRRLVSALHQEELAASIGVQPWAVCHPYGIPGDRLWVRETWGLHAYGDFTCWQRDSIAGRSERDLRLSWEVAYRADAESPYDHWRPSIHMPRWASRISLEVTSVRVERLQDITADDARAEGARAVDGPVGAYGDGPRWSMTRPHPIEADPARGYAQCLGSARMAFANTWNAIHGADAWNANPWVWVVGFERGGRS